MAEQGPLMPGDELAFGQAFAAARRAGVESFLWRDTLFNTRYRGETKEQWAEGRAAAKQQPTGAKQGDMKKTEVGKELSGSLLERIDEKLDAIFSMNEGVISEQFGSLQQVQEAAGQTEVNVAEALRPGGLGSVPQGEQ